MAGVRLAAGSVAEIRLLWDQIVDYAEACASEAAEGNSGEFSDPDEAERLAAAQITAETTLCEAFAIATGWRPHLVEGTQDNGWVDGWELRPVAGRRRAGKRPHRAA